jgi:hypothetical protein
MQTKPPRPVSVMLRETWGYGGCVRLPPDALVAGRHAARTLQRLPVLLPRSRAAIAR